MKATITTASGSFSGTIISAKSARATALALAALMGFDGRVIDRKGVVRVLSKVDSSKPGWGFVEVSK